MALRPILTLSLLTVALLAGCSDGAPSGKLTAIPGTLTVDGSTTENTYVAAVYPYPTNPVTNEPLCPASPPAEPCVDPSSHYKIHFMSLPEPSGDGYAIFQVGGTIGERSMANLLNEGGDMWGVEHTIDDEDQSTQFANFELRMGSFTVATASSAAGSQAFVASPALSAVTVTGSYKGKTLDIDVQGLPADVEAVGRFYKLGTTGNLTVGESFPVIAGAQSFTSEEGNIGDYVQFHIHVGTSKIYLYQATL